MTRQHRRAVCYAGKTHSSQGMPYLIARAVAIMTLRSGASFFTCYRHLNDWLDSADDHPHLEPTALIWIE